MSTLPGKGEKVCGSHLGVSENIKDSNLQFHHQVEIMGKVLAECRHCLHPVSICHVIGPGRSHYRAVGEATGEVWRTWNLEANNSPRVPASSRFFFP